MKDCRAAVTQHPTSIHPRVRFRYLKPRELLTFVSNAAIPLMIGVITLSISIHQQIGSKSYRDKDAALATKLRVQDNEQAELQRAEDKETARLQRFEDQEGARLQREEDKETARLQRDLDLNMTNTKRLQDNELAEKQRNLSETQRANDIKIAHRKYIHQLIVEDDRQKESILLEYQNDLATLLLDYESKLTDSQNTWWFVLQMKTNSALRQLDPARRTILVNTLLEAHLFDVNVSNEDSLLYTANISGVQFNQLLGTDILEYHDIEGFLNIATADMRYATFHKINLANSPSFYYSNLDYTDWSLALLVNIHFSGHMTMNEAKFTNTILIGTTFHEIKMNRASFEYNSECNHCRFEKTSLLGVRLNHSSFLEAKFSSLSMADANMSNGSFIILTFEDATLDRVDLFGADLRKCTFSKVSMIDCNMNAAVLNEATFSKVNLIGCKGLIDQQISTIKILYQTILPNGTFVEGNRG